MEQEIIQVDGASGMILRTLPLNGWTRGLAVTDNAYYFRARTPPREGTFVPRVTLEQQLVRWFDDIDAPNTLSSRVQISAAVHRRIG